MIKNKNFHELTLRKDYFDKNLSKISEHILKLKISKLHSKY
jgi:hypothetical protein